MSMAEPGGGLVCVAGRRDRRRGRCDRGGPRRIDVTVAVAGPDEHKILWEQLLARAPFFAKYQAKVEREIPIAVLTLIDPVGQAVPQCRFELFSGDDRGFVARGPWIGYAVTPRRADGRHHFVQRDRSRVALGVVVEHLGGPAPDPRHLALHGTLLCTASYGAVRAGNHDQAHDLLAEATATAARLGDHPDTRQRLTANITSHQVSVAHILGDPASALRHARAASASRSLSRTVGLSAATPAFRLSDQGIVS
jgi:hypothetical protein